MPPFVSALSKNQEATEVVPCWSRLLDEVTIFSAFINIYALIIFQSIDVDERWEDGERADDDHGAVHSAEAGPMQRGQKLPYPAVRSRVAQVSTFVKKKLMGSGQIWFSEALRVQRHYILSRFELIKGFRKIIEIRMFLADFSPNVIQ